MIGVCCLHATAYISESGGLFCMCADCGQKYKLTEVDDDE